MTQPNKLVPIEPSEDDILRAMDNAEMAGYDWVDDYRPSISDVEAIIKQYIASAPEVGEAVVELSVDYQGFFAYKQKVELLEGNYAIYATPQPDRTAELEDKVNELTAKLVYETAKSKVTEEDNKRLVEALRPLASLADHFPIKRKFGNRPNTGSIYSVISQNINEGQITVEDCHAAAALLAEMEAKGC